MFGECIKCVDIGGVNKASVECVLSHPHPKSGQNNETIIVYKLC